MLEERALEGLHLPTLTPEENTNGEASAATLGDLTSPVMVASELPYRGTSGGVVAGVKEQASTRKAIEGVAKPFILSEGLPPVPAKIVTRILRGEFIDMAELLRDNLEAQRRGALQDAPSSTGVSRSRREVPDLLSWVQCFSIYTAVMASAFPERVHKLLAYQTLIIREARRYGGKGWLAYDSFFRQQMSGEWQGEAWGRLNPYLFSSTFLACGASQRPNCSLCLECDHQEGDCALAKEKGSTVQCTPQLKAHSYREQMLRSVFPGTKGIAPFPIAATAMSASVVVGITRSYTAAWLGRMSGGIQGREIQSRWGMSDKPSHHKTDSCSCWH